MYRCKLGGLLCLFVEAMMDETQEKLDDHESGYQQPYDLVSSIETFALGVTSATSDSPNLVALLGETYPGISQRSINAQTSTDHNADKGKGLVDGVPSYLVHYP